jgi:hypothetical protein
MVDQASAGAAPASTALCRVQVWFEGYPQLSYRAARDAADRFARAMRSTGTRVTIDDQVGERLRPLPCERLWL